MIVNNLTNHHKQINLLCHYKPLKPLHTYGNMGACFGRDTQMGCSPVLLSSLPFKNSGKLFGLKSHDFLCDVSICNCPMKSQPDFLKGQAT
jgi:hypothetical protein